MSVDDRAGDCRQDFVSGVLALGLGIWYRTEAHKIENSLLSDAVGAGGVPGAVGGLVALVGVILIIKGLWGWMRTREALDEIKVDWTAHVLAACLVLLLFAYAYLLPLLGYVMAIVMLIGSAAYLGGARNYKTLLIFAVVSGPLLWLLFSQLLNVRLPMATWF
jgi:putative tricarboxylic transport membrane protein